MQRTDQDRRASRSPKAIRRRAILLLIAMSAFTAVAIAIVWLATEPGASPTAPASAPAVEDATPQAALPAARPPLPAGAGIAAPPEWRAQNPTIPAPVPNEAPPIAAPPPEGLPSDPAEREDAILELRRNRFADQIERLNRRTIERGGKPADAGARPPSTAPKTGSAASRRGSLSADE